METSTERTSADIQREIDADRQRIGKRVDAIQERMSPGQLVDEILAYAKGSGGGEYVSNLGQAVKTNPIPVALMGVGLAWLMAKQGTTSVSTVSPPPYRADYPLYPVGGPVRRLGPPETVGGSRYSHFSDNSGSRLKALTDETGNRAGHFIDEAGKTYRGFADASGKQIEHVADETGAAFDKASGWASDTWSQLKETAASVGSRVSGTANSLSRSSSSAGASAQEQASKLNDAILKQFRDQPLVGGALAFAVGAAIGAALPRTDQEDAVLGDAADATKEAVSTQASALADKGKVIASDAYDKVVSVVSDIHDAAKDRVVEEAEKSQN